VFLNSQYLQLVKTLPLTLIWRLHDSLFPSDSKKFEILEEKQPVVAILEISCQPTTIGVLLGDSSSIPSAM
jgi:hypothetical protein